MTPTTPTGKQFYHDVDDGDPHLLADILAIEAEAKAQERERLRAEARRLIDQMDRWPRLLCGMFAMSLLAEPTE